MTNRGPSKTADECAAEWRKHPGYKAMGITDQFGRQLYEATMATDPQAADLYQEISESPDPYTYPDSSNRDESRMCDEVSDSRSKRLMRAALDEVGDKVCGDRHEDYGDPVINHARTAEFWSTYLGIEIKPVDVCHLNMLQKLSRLINKYQHDGPIDIMGYAANAVACRAADNLLATTLRK